MRQIRIILSDLVRRARENKGIPQRALLESRLQIDVMIHHGHTHLQLSRVDEFPTSDELQVVIDNWPTTVQFVNTSAAAHSGRKYMTASWPAPPTRAYAHH